MCQSTVLGKLTGPFGRRIISVTLLEYYLIRSGLFYVDSLKKGSDSRVRVPHHSCKLSVEGLCVVVRLVEVEISPFDEVPG